MAQPQAQPCTSLPRLQTPALMAEGELLVPLVLVLVLVLVPEVVVVWCPRVRCRSLCLKQRFKHLFLNRVLNTMLEIGLLRNRK